MEILKRTDPDSFFITHIINANVASSLFGRKPEYNGERVTVLQIAYIGDYMAIFEVVKKYDRRIEMTDDEMKLRLERLTKKD